jgi:hypothetical protein
MKLGNRARACLSSFRARLKIRLYVMGRFTEEEAGNTKGKIL